MILEGDAAFKVDLKQASGLRLGVPAKVKTAI